VIVREVMTASPVTTSPGATLHLVLRLLVRHGLSSVPVVHDGRAVGVVSELDLLHGCLERDPGPSDPADGTGPAGTCLRDVLVGEVMTRRVVTVEPTTDLWDAARLLLEHAVKAAPVVAGGRVVGMLARRQVLVALSLDGRTTPAVLAATPPRRAVAGP
jgi:CBS domain-containing protein